MNSIDISNKKIIEILKSDIGFLKTKSKEIENFLISIQKYTDYVLFGGTARDIVFGKKPRDYDFVIKSKEKDILEIVNGYYFEKNRFDGYKVYIDNVIFDLWTLENTWAFKVKLLDESFENLPKSVFFNADAIAVNIEAEKVFESGFFTAFKDRMLHIILKDNPYPELCVLRALVLCGKYEIGIDDNIREYIMNWINSERDPYLQLCYIRNTHYKNSIYSKFDIKLAIQRYLNIEI